MDGRLIGQYRVTGVLGEGGMGIVYAAEHTLLGRPAAVKVLLPRFSSEQAIVQRFFNEARAATAIRHLGIVEVYDFGWTSDGAAFIVMELLQGETLRARHKRGLMRWSTALALARQIAGALGAAHAKSIVHRDLKPDNVFLIPDAEVRGGERIKLLDFGIAKLAGAVSGQHKTQTGALMGTPTYMAPEQCRGVDVDSRADLYALGCILFELCTGQPPFVGEGAGDVLAAHIYLPPPTMASLVGGVPEQIEALVRRMLAKSPTDRVQTADELIRLIDAAKAAIRQVARTDPQPAATASISDEDNDPTEREHQRPQDMRKDAAGPALVIDVQPAAARPNTTLSSAVGIRPRAGARTAARRSAVLGGVGGLAIMGAIAVAFALSRGEKDSDAPIQSASSTPNTESAASVATPPSPTVPPLKPVETPQEPEAAPPPATPPGPQESEAASPPATPPGPQEPEAAPPPATPPGPQEPEAAPPPATSPGPLEPTAPASASTPAGSTQPDASTSAASPLPTRTNAPRASVKSPPLQAAKVTIRILSIPAGAALSYENAFLGVTPQDLQFERGNYESKLVLRLSGYQPHQLVVRPTSAGQKTVKLKPLSRSQKPQGINPF
jgi:eukaryotic-like serine/threonine-protein kinase